MSSLAPIEKHKQITINGTVYEQSVVNRCKLCKTPTKDGHPITVCIFALMMRIQTLESRLTKSELK